MVNDTQRFKPGRLGKPSRWALSGGLLVCKHCGSNYASTKTRNTDYYACGSHIYRRGADCPAPVWHIPREEIENLIFKKITKSLSVDKSALEVLVKKTNEATLKKWKELKATDAQRNESIQQYEKQLRNCLDMVKKIGATDVLASEIETLSLKIQRLKRINDIEPPTTLKTEDLLKLQSVVLNATPDGRGAIIKQFVIEIIADSQTHTLEGILHDPRSIVAYSMVELRGLDAIRDIYAHLTPKKFVITLNHRKP